MKDATKKKKIRDGNLKLDTYRYNDAINKLEYLLNFREYVNKVSGCLSKLYRAILFCYCSDEVDNNTLHKQFKANYSIIEPIVSIDQAVEQLEYVYNRNLKPLSAHLDIHGLYKSYLKSTAMLNAIARKSRNEKV